MKKKVRREKVILSIGLSAALIIGVAGSTVAFTVNGEQTGVKNTQNLEPGIIVEKITKEYFPGDTNGDAIEGGPTVEKNKENGEKPKIELGIEVKSDTEKFAPDGDAIEDSFHE